MSVTERQIDEQTSEQDAQCGLAYFDCRTTNNDDSG